MDLDVLTYLIGSQCAVPLQVNTFSSVSSNCAVSWAICDEGTSQGCVFENMP